jgi:hypothetical protein
MRARMRWAPSTIASSSDVKIGAMGPSRPWSSLATRMIHVVEELSMIAISVLFVAGMVGLLVGM